uniref:NADH dehydrogenase subunit 6 n=1 Tax=Gonopsis affinis TaxID=1874122 RepID=A0A343RQB8_9HEMI|nr:NADH dehydrogenase subunit 6 [Gonopsis affinis]AUF71511.1 NADH dehydrogenase subunit 6 [Gonopsis affinis]
MLNFMLTLVIIWSITLMTLNHPLSMGLVLLMQTFMVAMIMGYIMESFFFSYIIIMIMMSGALVLFIYMSSVASNEKFNTPMKNIIMMTSLFILIYFVLKTTKCETIIINNLMSIENMSLMKIFNSMTSMITMMIIMYLLMTMIVVSNNAKVSEGPLRMKK